MWYGISKELFFQLGVKNTRNLMKDSKLIIETGKRFKKKKEKTFVIITANFFLEKYYGEWKPF